MWIRCLVVIAFCVAVPWTIGARVWRASTMLWRDLQRDLGDELDAAKRCWRNKTFD